MGFPSGSDGKESAMQETRFDPWVEKIPWRREWLPTSVFLPGEFHGQRSLEGLQSIGSQRFYSPKLHKQPSPYEINSYSSEI